MGVRGLQTLAQRRGGATLETIDADTVLLIDGSGLCMHLLRDQRYEYGGDMGALDDATTAFLERLLDRGFRVVVYLDGAQRRMKAHTADTRLAKRREEWASLERYADGSETPRRPAGDLPKPALASRVFEACLKRLDAPKIRKLTVLQCQEEADQRIAIDACRRKAVILGADSDFLVMRDVRYVQLEHAARVAEGKPVAVWTRRGVAAALNLSEALFVEACLLLGNDYTGHIDFDVEAPQKPEQLMEWLAGFDEEMHLPGHEGVLFSRALYNLQSLAAWPLDPPRVHDDGAPALVPEAPPAQRAPPETLDAIMDAVRALVVAPGGDHLLDPILESVRAQLAACLDRITAQALSGMLRSTCEDLAAMPCGAPPLYADVVAAYRYQRVLAASDLFRFLGAGARFDGPRRLFHGPGFHALARRLRSRGDDGGEPRGHDQADKPAAGFRVLAPAPAQTTPLTRGLAAAVAGLPIDAHREEILDTIARNRVTIISGETGCGKSSRLPLMLLEDNPKARMFVSQPRRIAARSLCDRVRQTLGDEVGLRLGFGERDEVVGKTRLWFCSTGYLVRLVAAHPQALRGHTHLIVDEVHERSVDTEILCLLLKRLVDQHPSIRVVLMSATVCVDLYASYFGVDPTSASLHVGSRRFPVTEYYADDLCDALRLPQNLSSVCGRLVLHTGERPPHTSAQHPLVKAIVRSVGTPGSSILVFVPGLADILDLTEKIEALGANYSVGAIHSEIPFEEQLGCFEKTDKIRVILATNAAESGVTIPDCDHVIDMGTAKELTYNKATHRSMLDQVWICRSSAVQRAGRTGRVRPGCVYRLYSRDRYERMAAHATSEIHRQPLDKVVLDLMTLETDLSAAAMLAETVEPPEVAAVRRSFDELHASALVSSADPDAAEVTKMGQFVATLGVDLHLGRMVGLAAQTNMLVDGATLAAVLSQPRSPWRIASPSVHPDPEEYNEIASRSFVSRHRWDAGMVSEPVSLLRLSRAWANLVSAKDRKEFCSTHNVVENRMRQLVNQSANLYKRALAGMDAQDRKKHDRVASRLQSRNPLEDAPRLNRLRLLLTWTTAPNGLFELVNVKHKSNRRRVGLKGPALLKEQVAALFPSSVDYAFVSGERHVYTAVLDTPVDSGFEVRLIEERGDADLCYAISAEGLVLLVAPGGRAAASDIILKLLKAGASCDAPDAWRLRGLKVQSATEDYAALRKASCSQNERRDLKALLDVCTSFGVSSADHNAKAVVNAGGTTFDRTRLEALLGLQVADVTVQTLSGKQAVEFPREDTADGLYQTLPLGAQIVSALASGRRGDKLELWRDPQDKDLGKHELKVEVAAPRYACCAWSDRRGECLMPHHTVVKTWLNDSREPQFGVAASMLDLSGGGVRAEACTLLPSLEWLVKALTVFRVSLHPMPHGVLDEASIDACCDLADAWAARGESLAPAPDLVTRVDRIFGFEDVEAEETDGSSGSVASPARAAPAVRARRTTRAERVQGLSDFITNAGVANSRLIKNMESLLSADDQDRRRGAGTIRTCEHHEEKSEHLQKSGRRRQRVNKYACGFIEPDDGSDDIFYLKLGFGRDLAEGLRVTYEKRTNDEGPVAHRVKPEGALVEASVAPPPPPPPRFTKSKDYLRKVLPFLKPEQRQSFYENDVTLDVLALLYDDDLDALLGGDAIAKSKFRALHPRPDDAPPPPPPQRPRAPPTLVSAVEGLHLEDEEPARVFLSIVSDVAGAAWTEDGRLGATLTKKGVRLALINLMRAGALKRRWVEYGRKRLDDGSILSTLEYVAWPKAVRSQLLAPQMYLRRTAEGVRALRR